MCGTYTAYITECNCSVVHVFSAISVPNMKNTVKYCHTLHNRNTRTEPVSLSLTHTLTKSHPLTYTLEEACEMDYWPLRGVVTHCHTVQNLLGAPELLISRTEEVGQPFLLLFQLRCEWRILCILCDTMPGNLLICPCCSEWLCVTVCL